MEAINTMSNEDFQQGYQEFQEKEERAAVKAAQDDVFNMSISDSKEKPGAARVFYKEVGVEQVEDNWWTVTLDGRRLKALESTSSLFLPTEAMAWVVANEWAQQSGHINKLLMPMTDIASGSQLVDAWGTRARLEHLNTFLASDNLWYRMEEGPLKARQAELCDPVCKWFESFYGVTTPRNVGLRTQRLSEDTRQKVHAALLGMHLNRYQVVSLYVVTQYTASLALSLALVHGEIDLPTLIDINSLEEQANIRTSVSIEGYHDVRDADVNVKLAAAHLCWQLTAELTEEQTDTPEHLLTRKKKKRLD